jgi:hypothetical protein
MGYLASSPKPTGNALINGGFEFFERTGPNAAARNDDAYGPDRWYVLTQTAAVNIERLADTAVAARYQARLKQSQAAAQRIGLAQIIEASNCAPFRNRPVRFQARVRCSSSQPIRCAIVAHTGAADSVVSDIVSDWTSSDYGDGAGKFFVDANLKPIASAAVTPAANVWTDLAVTGTLDAAGNNLIVFIWTEGPAAQNVTLDIAEAGFHDGAAKRDWLPRSSAEEFELCLWYYEKSFARDVAPAQGLVTNARWMGAAVGAGYLIVSHPIHPKRTTPAVTCYRSSQGTTDGQIAWFDAVSNWVTSTDASAYYQSNDLRWNVTSTSLTPGHAYQCSWHWTADSEL